MVIAIRTRLINSVDVVQIESGRAGRMHRENEMCSLFSTRFSPFDGVAVDLLPQRFTQRDFSPNYMYTLLYTNRTLGEIARARFFFLFFVHPARARAILSMSPH